MSNNMADFHNICEIIRQMFMIFVNWYGRYSEYFWTAYSYQLPNDHSGTIICQMFIVSAHYVHDILGRYTWLFKVSSVNFLLVNHIYLNSKQTQNNLLNYFWRCRPVTALRQWHPAQPPPPCYPLSWHSSPQVKEFFKYIFFFFKR